jgi:hypothetical protein
MMDQWRALKRWQQGAIVGGIVFLWLVGTITQKIEDRQIQQQAQQAQIEQQQRAAEVPLILDQIGASTGYRPRFIQWGQVQALAVPKWAFASLSMEQKAQVCAWVEDQYGGNCTIVLGRVDGSTMTLDEEYRP